jgi:hypothetical protein
VTHGGLALSRPLASAVIAAFIIACLFVLPQRAGRHPGAQQRASEAISDANKIDDPPK